MNHRRCLRMIGIIMIVITALYTVSVFAADDESYLLNGAGARDKGTQSQTTDISGIKDNGNGTYSVKNLNIPSDAPQFNGHYYYYFDFPDVSWSLANTICFVYGGNLVSITSAQEQAFIETQFPGTQGWIGASLNDEGAWEWTTDEPFEYTNWKQGEPNNLNDSESCVHLYTMMQWNDRPDDDVDYHRGFYCEWESDIQTYYYNGLFGDDISPEAKRLLEEGKTYYYGTGDEGYDISKARSDFNIAAGDGHIGEAWYYLGRIFANNLVDGENLDYRAMGAYERAVEYGSNLGWVGLGTCYLKGIGTVTDYNIAMQLYLRALELGCTEANYGIGILYKSGLGVERDEAKAMEYFEKATHSDNFGWRNLAACEIGDMYYDGFNGSEPDYETAFWWYSQGGQEGYGPSCYKLGYMYEKGYGTEQNDYSAFYWYDWGAWYGDKYAMSKLADCYYYGTGIEKNREMAFAKYMKAAQMDHPYAMYSVGYMYEYGQGTTQDLEQARYWYALALDNPDIVRNIRDRIFEELDKMDSGAVSMNSDSNNYVPQDTGYDTSADYGYDYDYQYETQPWEDPYFIGYTQDGIPQYDYGGYDYQYETQPWEDPYFIGYTQDGTPQYDYGGYDYSYETQPWEDPYFIGYTQDGTPQYAY